MKFKKNIVITVLIFITIIAVALYLGGHFKRNRYIPVSLTFDAKTMEVSFSIDEGYKIHRIQVLEGDIDIPDYDDDTREILFPAWKLDIGKQQFIYFVIQNNSGKVQKEYNVIYEILHQSDSEIFISVRSGKSHPAKIDTYIYHY